MKKRTRKVKAWAIIDNREHDLAFHGLAPSNLQIHTSMDYAKRLLIEQHCTHLFNIVPCTITYTIPTKRRRA